MKLINIAYDYEYGDDDELIDMGTVDVVLVPDFVCDNLDEIVQKFFDWIEVVVRKAKQRDYPEYWFRDEQGKTSLGAGTAQFVKWLNDHYFSCENQESVMIAAETEYNPNYPTALF